MFIERDFIPGLVKELALGKKVFNSLAISAI
jgi:hypothetical protein